ncbi:hypothetical protein AGMMS50256_37550 [Betaproteobacteria bacterium]|nr:hypothetical protein AGMMS50256_37550 [Betaproteobacteria bacterium]
MAVNYTTPAPEKLFPVAGIRLGVAEAGIRKVDRRDLTLLALEPGATVAGVFTQNRFCAAPVHVCREHLKTGREIRALVINTGNANAGTGDEGLRAAKETCAAVGKLLGIDAGQVLPFSTGVIHEPLPVDRLVAALPRCRDDLETNHWHAAAHAIMTTDTVAKAASRQVDVGGKTVTVTGMTKGSGMIHPNMATMLCFVTTDAAISRELLDRALRAAVKHSFNRVTVDGDTSTNDTILVMANGEAANAPINAEGADYQLFAEALEDVCIKLALLIHQYTALSAGK